MTAGNGIFENISGLVLGIGVCVVLYVIQLQNFLLFHSLVELFSIFVAFGVFIIAWNAREELESVFLSVLGIAYLFIGGVDLLHTLAYKGMGVFPEAGADLPTQLWILGRYLEAVSLFGAGVLGVTFGMEDSRYPEWSERAMPLLAAVYFGIVSLGLSSIFVFDVFPQAYVAGSGLTRFKIVSEYVIIVLLLGALSLLYTQRDAFDTRVYYLLALSIALSASSELAFTAYVHVYGLSNALGHLLKFGSFSLIYFAVVKTGLTDPQKTLYRTLANREARARKFEKAVEHSGHSVFITDRDGIIRYVNPTFEEITGYSPDEICGRTPRVLKSGEHDPEFYEKMWETILSGDVWESDIVNERKDGERFVVNQTIAPITDEEGTIQHFVSVHKDISERKKQEQELLQRYESLFDSIRDGILVTDMDRRIVNANPAFTDLFGYELADIEGESTKLLYEDDAEFERMGSAIRAHMGDQRFTRTTRYKKKSGQVFPVEITIFHLRSADDEIIGFIGLIRDVSGRENRIQQLQVLDRILRHNLRNAMNVIEGYATVIGNDASGETAENAQKIAETSDKLLEAVAKERKITNFLTQSQSVEIIDLTSVVESTVSAARQRFPAADISVTAPDDCSVRAIPPLSQATEELLENAIVHSDQEVPNVTIQIESTDGIVELRIADDGPGIPEMEQRVLTREAEIDPLYHGSGLGLWFVNLIIQQSNGMLDFDDNEPRGSVVTIRLQAE